MWPAEMNDLFAAVKAGDLERVREILTTDRASVHAKDARGATALHYAAEAGDRNIVEALLDAGADVNARDLQFGATPAGWAIEYLRQRGALLAVEIEDVRDAIANGNERLVERYVSRWPALREAIDATGTPLRTHALESGIAEIMRLFGIPK